MSWNVCAWVIPGSWCPMTSSLTPSRNKTGVVFDRNVAVFRHTNCGRFGLQTMSWGTLGTVRPFSNFHPQRDAVELQSALEKKGSAASASLGGNSHYLCVIPEVLTWDIPWLRYGDSGEDPDQSQQRSETSYRQDFWRSRTEGDAVSSVQLRSSEQNLKPSMCKHTTVVQTCLFIH